jgi:hypothetical protein
MSYKIITSDVKIVSDDKYTAAELIKIYKDFEKEVLSRLKKINPKSKRKVLPVIHEYKIRYNKYDYIFTTLINCLYNNKIYISQNYKFFVKKEEELDLIVDKLAVIYKTLKKFDKQFHGTSISISKNDVKFTFKISIYFKHTSNQSIMIDSNMPNDQIENIINLSMM